MQKKQTAVQFLLSHIADEGKDMIGRDIIEQALQMEREQIEDAFRDGQGLHAMGDETRAPQYYKRVFKSGIDAKD